MTDSMMMCAKRRITQRVRNIKSTTCKVSRPLSIVLFTAAVCVAQQATDEIPQPSTTLASQFFEHDFVNVFAFGDALYDTSLPRLTSASSSYGGSWGFDVGGGITANHSFKDGSFSFSYKGDYRHYLATSYSSGNDQSLSVLYDKRLNRQWSLGLQGSGGIVAYGGQFYSSSASPGAGSLTNPLSTQSRFANAGLNLTYQQTRRLSYTFGGQFFLSNYNYANAVNSFGGSGTAGVNYRLTARTTVGGSYDRSYFTYSGSLGTTTIDGANLNLSHLFPSHWTLSLSAGVNRSHSKGTITQAVSLLFGQQLLTGFVTGPFDRTNFSPAFQGTIARNMRHSLFSISGGQGINAGNGTFLTSKDIFVNSTYSLTHRLTNFSFGGGYTRLTSISNTVSSKYTTSNASVSYGFNIVRYLSANLRYDFIHYDGLFALKGVNESRISLGLSFSSKSIPLTLF